MTEKKKKIFVISDHPMAPSGVGTQTKNVIDALIKTGKYKFVCFGGAVKHQDYTPRSIENYGEDWIVIPVDGYGSQEMVRSVMANDKPDLIWFMTDPRFYEWLWAIDNEIRINAPMVYYHVWDNYPYPKFNAKFYNSTDVVACISKVTYDIVQTVSPEVESCYIPHAVDSKIFRPLPDEKIAALKKEKFADDRVTFFWNNRNARRKQSGSLITWFNNFAEEVGPEKVRLLLHTDPKDPMGQDLEAVLQNIGATDGRILISNEKVLQSSLAEMYNMADCTINISDAEGFGLATLESLSCQTPIIVTMTGGLQEQVTDGEEWFGIGIEPASKSVIGSQQVPYIYEDRISEKDFNEALHKIYNLTKDQRKLLGMKGRQHVIKNYNFEKFNKSWIDLIDKVVEERGSWDTRKKYKAWKLMEVK